MFNIDPDFVPPDVDLIVDYAEQLRIRIFAADDFGMSEELHGRYCGYVAGFVALTGIPRRSLRDLMKHWTEAVFIAATRGRQGDLPDSTEALLTATFDAVEDITPGWELEG